MHKLIRGSPLALPAELVFFGHRYKNTRDPITRGGAFRAFGASHDFDLLQEIFKALGGPSFLNIAGPESQAFLCIKDLIGISGTSSRPVSSNAKYAD